MLAWEDPPTATTAERAVHRAPTSGRTDLITVYRYRADPDPASRITIVRKSTAVERTRMLPAWATSWSDLEGILKTWFGF